MQVQDRLDILDVLVFKLWGLPYRWAGSNAVEGFDCSGGVLELLKSVDLWPAREDTTAQGLYTHFKRPEHGLELPFDGDPSFGTLVFFGASLSKISHVGMALNDELMFEFGGGDHTTTTEAMAAKMNAYGRIRPFHSRKDLLAFVMPLGLQSSP
jgi:cell wall-associated NlpC family hydrolase